MTNKFDVGRHTLPPLSPPCVFFFNMSMPMPVPSVLPSLFFTKAELAFILTELTASLSPDDNETRLEMVELRHYCNQVADSIQAKAKSGGFSAALAVPSVNSANTQAKALSLEECRRRFPTLTDEEIQQVLDDAALQTPTLPPPPSGFLKSAPPRPTSEKRKKDSENAKAFESLLGGIPSCGEE